MLWFWIMAVFRSLIMLGVDLAWGLVSIRLIQNRWWRLPALAFLIFQGTALLLLFADVEWHHYTPKPLFVAVVTWHYFGGILLLCWGAMIAGGCFFRWWAKRKNISATPSRPDGITRRHFVEASTALAPGLFNLFLTGACAMEQNQLRVRKFTIRVPTLPKSLNGTSIVHLTDLHVGPFTSERMLRNMVETTNAMRADLVFLTGDLINYEIADLSEGIRLAKALESRYGLWMVEGNHDLFENGNEFERRIKAAGLNLLLDETKVAQIRGCPVQLFGLRWISLGDPDNPGNVDNASRLQLQQLMRKRHSEAFPVVLAHHPHVFDAAVAIDLPITFAGHTHGGQWMLGQQRGVGSALFRYWSGLYSRRQSQLVVSNGVGNTFPLRINAPAEIIHVTLQRGTNV